MKRAAPALLLVAACAAAPRARAPTTPPRRALALAPPAGPAIPWRYDVAVGERARELAVDVAIPAGAWGDLEIDPRAEPFLHDAEASLGGRPFQPIPRDRKSTRLNPSHSQQSRMPSSA